MNKKFLLLFALVLMLCAVLMASCSNEETDHDHQYIERTKTPTCTEVGKHDKICTTCEDTVLIEVLPAKGHNPNDWQVKTEPTCTVNKVEEKICKDCGEVVETTVHPVMGHTPGEWQVMIDASCTQNLVEQKVCKVCAATVETRTGEKIQHEYVQITVAGNCAVGEHVLNTCKFCGHSYSDNYSEIREAHVDGGWVIVKAPTCSAEGLRQRICKICSNNMGDNESVGIDPENHSFAVETFPPADGQEGYTLHTCQLCGYKVKNEYESNFLPSQIYQMIVSATVRIEGCDKDGNTNNVGSGFFINANGEILTNYHVIAAAYQLKVKLYGGTEHFAVSVLGYDIANDIAVIKIDMVGNSYLEFSDKAVKTGDPVYALGSPMGIDNMFTSGIVSNPLKNINGNLCIGFTSPISPGNSGGPLVDASGKVVGIVTQQVKDAQNTNFAFPISVASELDTSVPKAVHEVYAETLSQNGISVLAYYIMRNYTRQESKTRYVIEKVILAENPNEKSYGRTLELIYDDTLKAVIISIIWTDCGRHLYNVDFIFDSIGNKYTIKMYDHVWSQYTAEGTIIPSIQVIANERGVIDDALLAKIFSFEYIDYPTLQGDPLTKTIAKQFMGVAYVHLLENIEAVLLETGTDLTMETFNFVKLPSEEEEEEGENEGTTDSDASDVTQDSTVDSRQ